MMAVEGGLDAAIVQEAGGASVIALTGDLDCTTVEALRGMALGELHDGRALVVDVADLRFLDSRGLALLIALHKRMRQANLGNLRLRNVQDRTHRLLEMTRLDQVFELEPTV